MGHIGDVDNRDIATAFERASSAGVIHQDLSHQAGRQGEQVRPISDVHPVNVHQAEVGFMDQGSRLEHVAGWFPTQPRLGDAPQLFIDQSSTNPLSASGIPLLPRPDHCRDIDGPLSHRWSADETIPIRGASIANCVCAFDTNTLEASAFWPVFPTQTNSERIRARMPTPKIFG